jgi:phosphatidylinositol alpha-1,6-mannosyltransferase
LVGLTHGHEVWWAAVPGARAVLRRVGQGCDHLTTISAFTHRRIAPALDPGARSRLLRLPPPVDVELFRPGLAEPGPRVVAVARFVRQKGLDTLLRAWARVLAAGVDPAAELVLVGDGPQRPALQTLARRLGVAGSVRFPGPAGPAAVVAELRRAAVFALPVRTRLGGLNPEGFGLAAVEAAACGLPVLVGGSGGAAETVRDGVTGWVLPSDDVAAWADRIVALLADPPGARAVGARGRAFVSASYGLPQARATLRAALRLDGDAQ